MRASVQYKKQKHLLHNNIRVIILYGIIRKKIRKRHSVGEVTVSRVGHCNLVDSDRQACLIFMTNLRWPSKDFLRLPIGSTGVLLLPGAGV